MAEPMDQARGNGRSDRTRACGDRAAHLADALPRGEDAVGHARLPALPQVREPAVHRVVQGARRAELPAVDGCARARLRRGRDERRQPCPGRRVPRRQARHRGHHLHAARHAVHQGRAHPRPGRRRAHRGRQPRRGDRQRRASMRASTGAVFLHPFDDPLVIAGQGTVALEMLQQVPELDTLVVPVGGGGLIAGMAVAAKRPEAGHRRSSAPSPEHYCAMHQHLHGHAAGGRRRHGRRRPRGARRRPAHGAHRARAGRRRAARRRSRDRARGLLAGRRREDRGRRRRRHRPRRAARHRERFAGRCVGVPLTGGNIDVRLLASTLLRGLARDGRLVALSVSVPDAVGSLSAITTSIAAVRRQHRRDPPRPAVRARVRAPRDRRTRGGGAGPRTCRGDRARAERSRLPGRGESRSTSACAASASADERSPRCPLAAGPMPPFFRARNGNQPRRCSASEVVARPRGPLSSRQL